jgi:predicted transcriptional regulator
LIVHLIKRCLDANPFDRPKAGDILDRCCVIKEEKKPIIIYQLAISLSYETHSVAIYTSRLLSFNNLPEPKNSDDYYDDQYDNLISEVIKFLGI